MANQPPPLPARRRVRKWILFAVFAPALVVLFAGIAYWGTDAIAVSRLESKAHARGEPLTLKDLEAMQPQVPEADDAAVALMAAWEKRDPARWQAFRHGVRPLPDAKPAYADPDLPFIGSNAKRLGRHGPLPATNRSAADRFLRENGAYLEEVRMALRRPKYRSPMRIPEGLDALLPHLAQMKSDAQAFRVRSLVAAQDGDNRASIASLRDMASISGHLGDEPSLIGQLVRISCTASIEDGISRVLSARRPSPGDLDSLRTLLDEVKTTNALRYALVCERAMDVSVFDLSLAEIDRIGSADGETRESGSEAVRGLPIFRAMGVATGDRRLMLATMDSAITLAETESPESLAEFVRLFQETRRKSRAFPPKILTGMTLPALEKAAGKFYAVEAARRAAIAGIAIERHRAANDDRLPGALAALVPAYLPAVPTDPFDGRPLRYKQLETGYVVYSVGPDLVDDGGRERGPRLTDRFDVTFTVER